MITAIRVRRENFSARKHRTMKIRPILIVLGWTCWVGVLKANPTRVVTLDTIAMQVQRGNPALKAAKIQIQEAKGRMEQAGLLSNPTVDSSLENNSKFREWRAEFGFSQQFPMTDRLKIEKRIGRLQVASAEVEVREVERSMLAAGKSSVVKLLALKQQRRLLEAQKQLANELSNTLDESAKKGETSMIDANLAKMEASLIEAQLFPLAAQEAEESGVLKNLLGMAYTESLTVEGVLKPVEMSMRAVDAELRPDYQLKKLEQKQAEEELELEKAKRYADVEAGAFIGMERSEDAPNGLGDAAVMGIRFKAPLPLWNKNQGAIDEVKAKQQRLQVEAQAIQKLVHVEAQAAYGEMQKWQKMIKEMDDRWLPNTEQQTALATEALRNGQVEVQSVFRSREKRLQLESARIEAVKQFYLARVKYETVQGKNL